jgi:hypothetical protein
MYYAYAKYTNIFKARVDKIQTSLSSASCGVNFNLDEDWLVFSNETIDGDQKYYYTMSCNGNKITDEVTSEIDQLTKLALNNSMIKTDAYYMKNVISIFFIFLIFLIDI